MSAPVVLRFVGVSRVYPTGGTTVRALDDVTLEVAAGELVAVMGQSGSGKSTLLALGGGLDTATAGEVRVEGTALPRLSAADLARLRRDRIGYVSRTTTSSPGSPPSRTSPYPASWPACRSAGPARRPTAPWTRWD